MKRALILFSVAVLVAGGVATMQGQSALDGFDPNANGKISIVAEQPNGKILIVGDFTAQFLIDPQDFVFARFQRRG